MKKERPYNFCKIYGSNEYGKNIQKVTNSRKQRKKIIPKIMTKQAERLCFLAIKKMQVTDLQYVVKVPYFSSPLLKKRKQHKISSLHYLEQATIPKLFQKAERPALICDYGKL